MDASQVLDAWGIRSLSPSSILKWADDKAAWVMSYALKSREPGNAAMSRGNAVEAGFEALLRGFDMNTAKAKTAELWALKAAEEGFDLEAEDAVAEAANLILMLEQCAAALAMRPLPVPLATQLRLDTWVDDEKWSAPVCGYADFVFDGWTLDLKTTKALPSAPKPAHVAQVACYAKARGDEHAALLYVTPKKFAFYDLGPDELVPAWNGLHPHVRSLLRALYRAKSVDDLCADYPPPIDSWFWSAERRATAATLNPAWSIAA